MMWDFLQNYCCKLFKFKLTKIPQFCTCDGTVCTCEQVSGNPLSSVAQAIRHLLWGFLSAHWGHIKLSFDILSETVGPAVRNCSGSSADFTDLKLLKTFWWISMFQLCNNFFYQNSNKCRHVKHVCTEGHKLNDMFLKADLYTKYHIPYTVKEH